MIAGIARSSDACTEDIASRRSARTPDEGSTVPRCMLSRKQIATSATPRPAAGV
jgi:hypothetical protein